MELDEIDPDRIAVTSVNERQENLDLDSDELRELAESVNEVGVVQPVILRDVHDLDDIDARFDVVIGQRRVEAARRVNQTVPAVIMDWDDEEALVASITENIRSLEKEVSTTDRAMALKRLWEQMGGTGNPDVSALSARLGVPRSTVSRWLEPLRDEWEGTDIFPEEDGDTEPAESDSPNTESPDSTEDRTEDEPDPDSDSDSNSDSDSDPTTDADENEVPGQEDDGDSVSEIFKDADDDDVDENNERINGSTPGSRDFVDERDSDDEIDVSEISSEKIAIVRRMTGGGEEGVRVLRRVVKEGLSIADVREVARRVDRGSGINEAIGELADVKQDSESQTVRVHLSGERRARLERVADSSGMSMQEATIEAIDMFLDEVDAGWF